MEKTKTTKHAGGRPTKYKPEYERQVQVLAEKGLTDKEIAQVFSVEEKTINNWKKAFPEFLQALKKGKEISDDAVEKSLFERATGYSVPEVHISNYQGKITKTPVIKHYPPDPTSMIFWLKNRRPAQWRDRQENEVNFTIADFMKEAAIAERSQLKLER